LKLQGAAVYAVIAYLSELLLAVLLSLQLLARIALLDLLIIVAPLGLVCFALPQTQAWARLWAQAFVSTLLAQFLQLLCIAMGSALSAVTAQATANLVSSLGSPDWSVSPVMLLVAIVSYVLAFKIPGMLLSHVLRAGVGDVQRDIGNAVTVETAQRERQFPQQRGAPSVTILLLGGCVLVVLLAFPRIQQHIPAWIGPALSHLACGEIQAVPLQQILPLAGGLITLFALLIGGRLLLGWLRRHLFAQALYTHRRIEEHTAQMAYRVRLRLYVLGPTHALQWMPVHPRCLAHRRWLWHLAERPARGRMDHSIRFAGLLSRVLGWQGQKFLGRGAGCSGSGGANSERAEQAQRRAVLARLVAYQSIYGWRGSHPTFLIDFDRYFPSQSIGSIELTDNFRSRQPIIAAAEAVLEPVKHKTVKQGKSIFQGRERGLLDPVRLEEAQLSWNHSASGERYLVCVLSLCEYITA
jgi:hypothetical protein